MGKSRSGLLNDATWRCRPHLSRQEYAAEQDIAAGGRVNRLVPLSHRTALASVSLRRKADGRRIYAYLRWYDRGKTIERYIGEVDEPSRAGNLREAWRSVAQRGLIDVTAPQRATPVSVEARTSLGSGSWASSPTVRAVMRANKGRDTRPELAVRSAIHALGLRYRVGIRPVPAIRRTAFLSSSKPRRANSVRACSKGN